MATHETNSNPSAYDVQTPLVELVGKVEAGEEVVITREGIAVARLVPVSRSSTPQEREQAIQRILELRKGLTLGGLKIRDLIDEGRR